MPWERSPSTTGANWDKPMLTPELAGYYTPAEAQEAIGGVSRNQIAVIAKREGWPVKRLGNINLYPIYEVSEYALARLRTRLARQLGWRPPEGQGLLRHDEYDIICPICGGFAVEKPGKDWKEHIEIMFSSEWPWICENGHSQDDTPPAG